MHIFFDGAGWIIPLYGALVLFVTLLILVLEPLVSCMRRRRYNRSVRAAHRYRSF
ncbi:hypothetical protein SB778_03730 [Paraburkholderia sp. SIMBA_050]